MLRNTLTASAASTSRSVAATSTTSSPLYGYIITRTSSSSSSRTPRPTRPPRQTHRRQSNLTYRLFEKAGLDLEEAQSRREDALARGEKPNVEEQGWKRSGLGWKVRRGNMMARQRRGYATLAGQTPAPTPRSVLQRRPPGEIRPGDLIQYPSVDGHAWGIVMPCHPVAHLFQTKQFFALSSFGTITLLKQSAVVMHLPDLLASEGKGGVDGDGKRATIGEKEAMLLVEEATGLSGKDEIAARLDETVGARAKAARARMAARLRRVVKEADDELEQLRGRLAHAMAREEGLLQRDEVSVDEVATMLMDGGGEGEPLPTSTLIATHKLLTSMPRYLVHLPPAKAYKMAQTYAIRPQAERDLLDEVEGWRRTPDSPLDPFAAAVKAGAGGGGKVDTTQHAEILQFLLLSLSSTTTEGQSDPFAPTVDAILKRCDRLPVVPPAPYGEAQWVGADRSRERRQAAVVDLLEEVGAVSKRTDWSLAGGRSRRWLETAIKRMEAGVDVDEANLATDLDSPLRRAFHSPVFVIDDATAHELDDGISVSPTPESDGSVWVHIHIADPTSHLTPSSYPAQVARKQGSTLYLSNGASIPMFPRGSTRGIDEKDERGVRRVVTFSARVSPQGNVVETRVGLNDLQGQVRKFTYDDVDAGRVSGHEKELKMFAEVAERLLEARMKAGALSISDADSRLQLGTTTAGANVPTITSTRTSPQADHQGSQPSLLIPTTTTSTTTNQPSPSRTHVAEYMILAGRIASDFLWRQQGGIAAVYRSQRFPDEVAGKWKAALRCGSGGGGGEGGKALGRADVLRLGIAMPSAVSRSTPDEHVTMGIASHPTSTHSHSPTHSADIDLLTGSGYLRVTSPLRRYEDVVAHWQIKAALHNREEGPLFSLKEMDAELPEISRRAEAVQAISRGSGNWWKYRALRLVFEGKEGAADDDAAADGWKAISHADFRNGKPLTAYVLDGSLSMDDLSLSCTTRVTLPELGRGFNAECLWPMAVGEGESEGGMVMEMPKMGQEVKVEVVGVRESIETGGWVAVRPVKGRVEA